MMLCWVYFSLMLSVVQNTLYVNIFQCFCEASNVWRRGCINCHVGYSITNRGCILVRISLSAVTLWLILIPVPCQMDKLLMMERGFGCRTFALKFSLLKLIVAGIR